MGRLERFRGHFYNWYDTRDLRPLDPRYVSTVDSGNLAGHLIALANACREWTVRAPTAAQRLAGIADALDLAREATDQLRDGRRTQTVTWQQLDEALTALAAGVRQPDAGRCEPRGTAGGPRRAGRDHGRHRRAPSPANAGDDAGADMLFWLAAARRSIDSHRRDLDAVAGRRRRPGDAPRRARNDRARRWRWRWTSAFCSIRDRKLLSIGYRVPDGTPRPELLRSARLRGAAGELRRHRQGRRSGARTGSGSAAP